MTVVICCLKFTDMCFDCRFGGNDDDDDDDDDHEDDDADDEADDADDADVDACVSDTYIWLLGHKSDPWPYKHKLVYLNSLLIRPHLGYETVG